MVDVLRIAGLVAVGGLALLGVHHLWIFGREFYDAFLADD